MRFGSIYYSWERWSSTVYTVQDRVQYVPWDMIPFLIIISLNRGHSTARVYIPALRSGTERVSSRRLD